MECQVNGQHGGGEEGRPKGHSLWTRSVKGWSLNTDHG